MAAPAIGRPRPVDALGPRGPYRSSRREVVRDVAGEPVAELTMVPPLYLHRALDLMRATSAESAAWSPGERAAVLRRAADLFAGAVLGGLGPDEHHLLVARTTGVPVSVARAAASTIALVAAHAVDSAESARPLGGESVVWRRRGRLFTVTASGNHPSVHSLWLEALALGYRVAVRPSRRDPFTALRVVLALREAGWPTGDVVLLPCDHATSDDLVRGGDLAMVFGGDAVVAKHTGGARRTPVLTQGPGRVKLLVTGDWEQHLDVIAESVGGLGGVSCLNTTAVLAQQDAAGLAEALAERLSRARPLPPEHEAATLPCAPLADARALEAFVRASAAGAVRLTGPVAHDLGDGSAALGPAVHLLDGPFAEQTALELPFPCAWVAPWSRDDGVAPLRGSLVVGTDADDLVDDLVDEPSVRNVYDLARPTWWLPPGVPHDGYLAEFLMRSTAVARG
ncbi:aldehyde dehydrogenase family protein [Actinosynnema pretiosum]|uniref:Aldehyde dehydrogenase domain-containing protein n=1 Tax=Actinosynnema pretiosum TaxID=42197 RepID=A0A290ZAN7_9PSEU|nr:aldehyde dehydrogenase family protein [Actinosynnema pretiosum]ATE56068.1 hypothetical protein CNX65_24645 [Actinosynnema pretiosum]